MSLWLVRHAQPLFAQGVCYGALDVAVDPELTQAAAEALVRALPDTVTVFTSPLQRCVQLADCLVALRPELRYQTDSRLREMDFGCWEGVPWADIPKESVDQWTADFARHRFGGKESANDVMARVASAWDERQDRTTLWITHSGVAQAVTLLQQGVRYVAHARDWPLNRLKYGEWVVV